MSFAAAHRQASAERKLFWLLLVLTVAVRGAHLYLIPSLLMGMNQRLAADIETVFMVPSAADMFISATLVKEIARYRGDVSEFVDPIIEAALQAKIG